MKVNQFMTSRVKTCRTTALLHEAAHIMLDSHCGCVPIVDSRGRLAGMITDRDICLAVAGREQNPWEIPVRDVMSVHPVSCLVADDIDVALVAMKEHRIRRIPVVNDDGHVKGILSIDDLIRHTGPAKGQLPAEAVVDVLRHIWAQAQPEIVAVS